MLKKLMAGGMLTTILSGLVGFGWAAIEDIKTLETRMSVAEKDATGVHGTLRDIKADVREIRHGVRDIAKELRRK